MTFWRRHSKDEAILVNAHDLDQIGFRNEVLRNQIEEIEHGLRQVDSFKESFREMVTPISGVLEELETTRSELQEARAKLSVATDSLHELNARHFAQSSAFEATKAQVETLTQERSDLDRRLKFAQFALEERSSAADHRAHDLDATRIQLQAQTRKSEEIAAELQAVKAELDEKYRAASSFEQSLTIALDQNSLLAQNVDSLGRANEGHIEQITRHLRRESDLEAEIEQANGQIAALKSTLAQAEVAAGMARLQHEEVIDRMTAEKASVADQLEAVEDRAAAIERLLDEARQQLGAKVDEARGLELKSHEQTTRVVALEKKVGSLQDDLTEVEARLAQSNSARQTLVERSKALVNSMEAKSASLEKAEARIQYLNARLEEFAQNLQDQRNQSDQHILQLTQEIEKQRAERVLAEGALQASRRTRLGSITVDTQPETWRGDQEGDRAGPEHSRLAEVPPRVQVFRQGGESTPVIELKARAF